MMDSLWVWPIIALAYFNGICFAIRPMLKKHIFTTNFHHQKIWYSGDNKTTTVLANFIYAKLVPGVTTE
jgi:hypothetical protein